MAPARRRGERKRLAAAGGRGSAPVTDRRERNVAITAEATIELVPVMRERMADLETPVSAFAKLRGLGGAFLLESAEGGERMGRFSFIGVAPREVIVSRDGDPLARLRAAMAGYERAGGTGLPRFSGGAVGYVAYEAARHFER